MTWIGPITLYAHAEHDEEYEEYADEVIQSNHDLEPHRDLVEALHWIRPLYEVGFEFYVDPETREYYCDRVISRSFPVLVALPLREQRLPTLPQEVS